MTSATETSIKRDPQLQQLMINTIRTLSIDAVQKANSGHPGAPLGAAPMAYTLFTRFLRFNPTNPDWANRDRFVLSAGHASMLLYSLLYLTGYELTLDDIKQFRQWGSKTPGHPEYEISPGVEATTGPLGQGFANGIGMAIAEAYLGCRFNRPGFDVVNHHVYALVSDGDLQEGIASEAASLAGHLKLGKLIYLYDRNHVQLSGPTTVTFTENVLERFRAYGWHTSEVEDGNDVESISRAIQAAQQVHDRPSLIAVNTIIGFGSPEASTFKVHGEPLGVEGVKETKKALGWPPDESFFVPQEALDEFRKAVPRGEQVEAEWTEVWNRWKEDFPDLADEWERAEDWKLPEGWKSDLPAFTPDQGSVATREASGAAMNGIASNVALFIGGDADLAPSTKTQLKAFGDFEPGNYGGRNIHFGVRENSMGSIVNGIVLHGFLRSFGATFFAFLDYQRPAVRLASIMRIPTIFVYTHDSVLLGEDGPTHQPVEHLMSLRAMPNLVTIRPADANETVDAWTWAIQSRHRPVALVLTRQKVPILERAQGIGNLHNGAYVLSDAPGGDPDVILMGSGSEVSLLLGAQAELATEGVRARVVSFPSWEIFEEQTEAYKNSVFPPSITARLSVEAGSTLAWCKWVGDKGASIGIDHFGASAPAAVNAQHMGLTVENVVKHARLVLGHG